MHWRSRGLLVIRMCSPIAHNRNNNSASFFAVALSALLVVSCRAAVVDSAKSGANENASAVEAVSRSEAAPPKSAALADNPRPADARTAQRKQETVFNGDSKPPEMTAVASCVEMQSNRCVSCCEDYFKFGSDHWDQCVSACPQVGVEALVTEY